MQFLFVIFYFVQVHKNSRESFLMSGCKVADGSGTMLVTNFFLQFLLFYFLLGCKYVISVKIYGVSC